MRKLRANPLHRRLSSVKENGESDFLNSFKVEEKNENESGLKSHDNLK